MKKFKLFFLAAMVAMPLMMMPTQTRANGILDWIFGILDGNQGTQHHREGNQNNDKPKNNSAPIDGGLVVLMVAGAGLGAFVLYRRKKETESAVI